MPGWQMKQFVLVLLRLTRAISIWKLSSMLSKIQAHRPIPLLRKLPMKWALTVQMNNKSFLPLKAKCEDGMIVLTKRLGGGKYKLRYLGTVFPVSVMDELAGKFMEYMPERVEKDTSTLVLAPMPGMLKSVSVEAGDEVAEGQEVCVLEAMKMQNSLIAAKMGKVKAVHFKAGQTVDEGDVIVELE
ncbi:hypothetical protein KUTeg_011551 [Tegillarca granosa]|uniref:Lipoyl-binding domain-containing protein n=1 Tax=Tegillarca granosa TaxID=220873 RepID=A0ABQ9F0G3_TEGGR|nr:hypothetical protein KUTeg_011551 [Tegillarca granosa]